MAPALAFVPLTDSQVRARFNGVIQHLDHWGDVLASDSGSSRSRRLLEFELLAPGGELAVEVEAIFREYYRRTSSDEWDIAKYTYEYLDRVQGWRLAFHMHDIGGSPRVMHAHCESAFDIPDMERSEHLRAVEYELREAHAEFMRLYAAELAPDCARLLPLAVDRT